MMDREESADFADVVAGLGDSMLADAVRKGLDWLIANAVEDEDLGLAVPAKAAYLEVLHPIHEMACNLPSLPDGFRAAVTGIWHALCAFDWSEDLFVACEDAVGGLAALELELI